MQCFPSFDWNWGKLNDPTVCWQQLHPRYRVLQHGKCLSCLPDCVGKKNHRLQMFVIGVRDKPIRERAAKKTINVFSHFHGLIPDTNYKHLECFVMLGTHSKLHRGQMSHICDISPLRVNTVHIQ